MGWMRRRRLSSSEPRLWRSSRAIASADRVMRPGRLVQLGCSCVGGLPAEATEAGDYWRQKAGAGEGNRTLVISLEGCCSTIELHPHQNGRLRQGSGRLRTDCLASRSSTVRAGLPAETPPARRLVGEVGLEPTKAKPADLQSAPFAARDTPPERRSGAGIPACAGCSVRRVLC